MPQKTYELNANLGGVSIQGRIKRDGEDDHASQVTVPKGQAGTLTARTDANTGAATLSTGHGIETGHVVDVVWAGGSRKRMAATVSGNVVSLEGGSGTDLPVTTTAVTVYRRMTISIVFEGDKLVGVAAMLPVAGIFSIFDDAPAALLDEQALVATEPWFWIKDTGAENPLASEVVATIEVVSRGSADGVFKFGYQYDSVA